MKFDPKSSSRSLRRIACTFLFAAATAAGLGSLVSLHAVPQPPSPNRVAAEKKIASWVNGRTQDGKQAEFIVVLKDQADLSGAALLTTKAAKGHFVRDALWNKAQATQGPILKMIEARGLEHRAFYIVNAIWVKGRAEDVMAIAERADVERVEGNPEVRNYPTPLPAQMAPAPDPDAPATIEQGIAYTNAPAVWALGFTGQGIVVADGDTGFRWTHNGTGVRQAMILIGMTACIPAAVFAGRTLRNRVTTMVTAPTPWARRSATTAAGIKLGWLRERSASAAAT